MMRKLATTAMLAMAASSLIWTQPVFSAAAPTVVRKVLMQQDVPNGAQLALVSEPERRRAETIAASIDHVSLAAHPDFQDIFVECMNFPAPGASVP